MIAAAVTFVTAVALVTPEGWIEGIGGIATQGVALLVAGVGANMLLLRRGWSKGATLGWDPARRWSSDFAFGGALGLIMAGGALAIAVWAGSASIWLTGESVTTYLQRALPYGVALALAALGEELVFRGYPLARLAKTVGKLKATVVLAAVFAAAHLWNPDVSAFGLANIALASLVLSAAFFTPGGLPTAWGLHFGWNGALGIVADAPVSGIRFDMPALDFATGGPAWVTGGAFGPEGGFATTVVMGVALVWLWKQRARAPEGVL